jgi:RNA polymerase sigma-70 factor (ECF subfamily)
MHFPAVLRTVFLIIHDRPRAEEVTQDAFVKLLQKWRMVSQYEHPEAWVRQVAVRMAIRQARRESVRGSVELRGQAAQVGGEPLPDVDLALAVRSLAPMQRAAVVLYYLDDRPVAEIAHLLQVSESTVKQHLYRARQRLAELLHEEVSGDVG